jgi:Protein of unknown function (DUF2750)
MPPLIDDIEKNHDSFILQANKTSLVWGLKFDAGWAVCPSNDYVDATVFPFWSDPEYAKIHCVDEWSHYRPASIELGEFIQVWLGGMSQDGVLVGTNWNSELEGIEIEAADLANELLGENG